MDPVTTATAIKAAEQVASSSDRVAFFVALLVIGAFGLYVVKYLTSQTSKLIETMAKANADHAADINRINEANKTEWREMLAEHKTILRDNTKATAEQNELIRTHSGAFRVIQNLAARESIK